MSLPKIYSFPPIIDQNSRVLILGSMPGGESLRKQEYYAHPRNHFWPIIFRLFEKPQEVNYQRKVAFLKEKGIALWDVIAGCYRQGSLDAQIKDEEANDLPGLLNEYPQIKNVFFNGGKAYEIFNKEFGFEISGLSFVKLNSTSPANTKTIETKLEEWRQILDYLN